MVQVPLNAPLTTLMGSDGFTTKYEEYPASNQDGSRNVFGANWMAMLFTPGTGHTLNGLKLPIYRTGTTMGEISISIQALAGGDPDGTDLSLTKFAGLLLPTSSAVKIISMPAVLLTVSVQYAIVVRAAAGDASNTVNWDTDDSTPTYAGGHREDSANSGNTWTAQTGTDMIFEEWGFA